MTDNDTTPATSERIRAFIVERDRLNVLVSAYGDLTVKRFLNLDNGAYHAGALPSATKELMGLVAALVLRSDDDVLSHLARCREERVTDRELVEALGVSLVVGGAVTLPHLRRAVRAWDEMKTEGGALAEPTPGATTTDAVHDALLVVARGCSAAARDRGDMLGRVCQCLASAVAHYSWVGFYLVDAAQPDELALGPYVGETTEYTHIPFGRGICGQSAVRQSTLVVQDVSAESNYIARSPRNKAEVVVPVFSCGKMVGQLDIDSHQVQPFTPADHRFLESLCRVVGERWDGPWR